MDWTEATWRIFLLLMSDSKDTLKIVRKRLRSGGVRPGAALPNSASVRVVQPPAVELSPAIKFVELKQGQLALTAIRADAQAGFTQQVSAVATNGRELGTVPLAFKAGEAEASTALSPSDLRTTLGYDDYETQGQAFRVT